MRRLHSMMVAAGLVVTAGTAGAAPCYMVFDRFDNVVYRSTVSPVDMSDQGAAARAALRQRGEYLLVMESERCPPVTFLFGAAGSKTLSIDETVGGFPPDTPAAGGGKPRRGTASTLGPAPASAPDRPTPGSAK